MAEIKWMNYTIVTTDEGFEEFPGLTARDETGDYIHLGALELLGKVLADKAIPCAGHGRLVSFKKRPKEEVEDRARELGATIIAEPSGELRRRRDLVGYYYFFKEKPR